MSLLRSALAGLLVALAAPASATAAVPTHEQVQQLQQLFGFDGAISRVMEAELSKEPALAGLEPAQRQCLVSRIEPTMSVKLVGAFRELFGDEQTAGQWIAFAETNGGRKLMEFVRLGLEASLAGKPEPTPDTVLGGMPMEDMLQVVEFMKSPAAKVLEKDFPDMDLSDAELGAFMDDAQTHCGIKDATTT